MIQLHIEPERQWGAPLGAQPGLPAGSSSPKLEVSRTARRKELFSDMRTLLAGPAAPKIFLGAPYFRDCWIDQRSPRVAFGVAVACQVLVILFPPPVWNIRPKQAEMFSPPMELTWYGPAKDFAVNFGHLAPQKTASQNDRPRIPAGRSTDGSHPRQTILSETLHRAHPRQTLIQPAASLEPPRILPELPNMVRLAGSGPVRPNRRVTAEQLAPLRPKAAASLAASDAAAPEITRPETNAREITIASSVESPAKPALPVSPMPAPRHAPERGGQNLAAPEFIQQPAGDSTTLIAVSVAPAPVAPPASVPPGNLSARISISPEGSEPGRPTAAPDGKSAKPGPATGAGSRGPTGIFISGGNNTVSEEIGSISREVRSALPVKPTLRASLPPRDSNAPRLNSGSAPGSPKLDVPPEKVLGSKRVFTLHVNMPNLTSASGSWVLNFAELDEMDLGAQAGVGTSELAGPVPLRKVDPKYPPQLRTEHVEGEVILYAIIRKDGTVDSIQLVHSVDTQLDANAMEALAQWKFQPAEKLGEPIDLEAVVHIPFRSRTPAF
jgi:TonB family protein